MLAWRPQTHPVREMGPVDGLRRRVILFYVEMEQIVEPVIKMIIQW